MRVLLFVLALTGTLFLFAGEAAAAEAPSSAAAAAAPEAPAPRGPIEQPEDWIAVAGIFCYSVVPIVAILTLTYLTYRFFVNQSESALMPWQRSDWLFRGTARVARPPPGGLVLLRF